MRRVMLTVLGVGARPATYRFKDREGRYNALLSPVALIELTEPTQRPQQVFAVVTPRARVESLPALTAAVAAIDPTIAIEAIDVPDMTDLAGILGAIASRFEEEDALVLDVTHGARHMPFLMYAVSLYLVALKRVRLDGAFYAMFIGPNEAPSGSAGQPGEQLAEFMDLKPLLELPRWTYAVASFQQSGNANQLADLMQERHGQRLPGRAFPLSTARLATRLREVGEFSASGLPLETGLAAASVAAMLRRREFDDATVEVPLNGDLRSMVERSVAPMAIADAKDKKKPDLILDTEELRRQVHIVKMLIRWGHFASATTLLREWFVTWCIWSPERRGKGPVGHWLSRNVRDGAPRSDSTNDEDAESTSESGATGFLNEIDKIVRSGATDHQLSEREVALAKAWNACRDIRNSFAHCGMSKDEVEIKVERLEEVVRFAESLIQDT